MPVWLLRVTNEQPLCPEHTHVLKKKKQPTKKPQQFPNTKSLCKVIVQLSSLIMQLSHSAEAHPRKSDAAQVFLPLVSACHDDRVSLTSIWCPGSFCRGRILLPQAGCHCLSVVLAAARIASSLIKSGRQDTLPCAVGLLTQQEMCGRWE